MKFVFWQNVVSIHQSAFIKALAEKNEVTLVAAEELDALRKQEKWTIPSMGNAQIIIDPTEKNITELLDKPNTYHIFSGINAFPSVYKVLKRAIKLRLSISVLAEPYEWSGIKGKLRRLMYMWLNFKYHKYIQHIFATGDTGIQSYLKAGFLPEKLHQWGYFTEQDQIQLGESVNLRESVNIDNSKVNLIYVGRLDRNKNILPLLKRFESYGDKVGFFSIVGDGPLMEDVHQIAYLNSKIKVYGRLTNKEACNLMREHDYLILPSLYDGWGAVVNEALAQGTRVLCSESCGASILLDGKMRGETFSQNSSIETINKWIDKGKLSPQDRNVIKSWALDKISGKVAANYFIRIFNGDVISAPWIEQK